MSEPTWRPGDLIVVRFPDQPDRHLIVADVAQDDEHGAQLDCIPDPFDSTR